MPDIFKKDWFKQTAVLLFFGLSAFVQLLPLSLHPADSLNDAWDCLLNTWILGWDQYQLGRNPLHLYDANIFYPHRQTLSYSETLLPLAVLSWPVAALTKNPILAYNFAFFLSCLLNAYAMFLLVKHLTGRYLPGLAAGLIFAFSATLMQQITHLQLVAAWFIPLALLQLHRFFDSRRWRHSILFALFLLLQALTCVYYGLFFLSLLPLILAVMLLLNRKKVNPAFLLRLGAPLLAAGLALLAYSLPFLSLFRNYDFQRGLEYGADLQNYLAVPPHNLLLGRLLSRLGSYEYFLFPGLAAVLLAALWAVAKAWCFQEMPRRLKRAGLFLCGLPVLLAVITLMNKGFKLKLGSLSISMTNPAKQVFVAMILAGLFISVAFVFYLLKHPRPAGTQGAPFLYIFILYGSLALSWGSGLSVRGSHVFAHWAPFAWLYDHVPGFKGIRVPSRYAVFVILALAILAAWGLDLLARKFKPGRLKLTLAALLLVAVNLEYWSYPQRLMSFPVGRDIPPTYLWLAEQKGDFAVIELPMTGDIYHEAGYMYFSLFHKKKIMNGYSGFLPPTTDFIRELFQDYPSRTSLDLLQDLGIKYVIFHAKRLRPLKAQLARDRMKEVCADALREVKTFTYRLRRPTALEGYLGDDTIYEVLPKMDRPLPPGPEEEAPPASWRVESSLNPGALEKLKDGHLDTAWTTGQPKDREETLDLAFAQPMPLSRISLSPGAAAQCAAGNLVAYWSMDGIEWSLATPGFSASGFFRALVQDPKHPTQDIFFSGRPVRLVKIEQTGKSAEWPWSVAELRVFLRRQAP
jgi:hypothetical protein